MQRISTTTLGRELSGILDRVAAIARLMTESPGAAQRRRKPALAESNALRSQLIAKGKALSLKEIVRFKGEGRSSAS